jgi:predicted metal-dependent HD superfamily phosphohydrolase
VAALDDALLQPLRQRYAEPHRAYHGIRHIEALLALQARHADLIRDPRSMSLAIWFHDAVYDTRSADNEEQSALLAGEMLGQAGMAHETVASVQRKIRATQRHEWTDADPDTAVFLDLDLAILGADEAAYDRYASQIAAEYAWVPDLAYREGRAKVLHGFLQRPCIYFTPRFRLEWEAAARGNLARELALLA